MEGLEFDLLGLVEVDLVVFFVAFFFCSLTCVEGGDMDGEGKVWRGEVVGRKWE